MLSRRNHTFYEGEIRKYAEEYSVVMEIRQPNIRQATYIRRALGLVTVRYEKHYSVPVDILRRHGLASKKVSKSAAPRGGPVWYLERYSIVHQTQLVRAVEVHACGTPASRCRKTITLPGSELDRVAMYPTQVLKLEEDVPIDNSSDASQHVRRAK